jgi:hypothetical protein
VGLGVIVGVDVGDCVGVLVVSGVGLGDSVGCVVGVEVESDVGGVVGE